MPPIGYPDILKAFHHFLFQMRSLFCSDPDLCCLPDLVFLHNGGEYTIEVYLCTDLHN